MGLLVRGQVGVWDVSSVVVLLEELHALVGESNGSSSVERRGSSTLESVSERSRSGVEKLGSLLFEDVGEELGGVNRG